MTVSEISDFQAQLKQGIPDVLPPVRPRDESVSHAPRRKQILTPEEERLALRNALRYFPQKFHAELAPEFVNELRTYGRIYMYRFRPDYKMYARPVEMYPAKSQQAAAIMMMIQNNLDPAVAQHPHHLWRQRRGVPELGTVSPRNEISVGNDRRADSRDVLRPSPRAIPITQGGSESSGHQRYGHPQSLQA